MTQTLLAYDICEAVYRASQMEPHRTKAEKFTVAVLGTQNTSMTQCPAEIRTEDVQNSSPARYHQYQAPTSGVRSEESTEERPETRCNLSDNAFAVATHIIVTRSAPHKCHYLGQITSVAVTICQPLPRDT
jgi:hypothetical protein